MGIIHEGIDYLTIDHAAEQLATTGLKVLMLLKRHELNGVEINGRWIVSAESVAYYKTHGKDITAVGCRSHCSSNGCGCR